MRKAGEEGKCQKMAWEEAEREFGATTVSRVGLIEQDPADGRKIHIYLRWTWMSRAATTEHRRRKESSSHEVVTSSGH